MLDTYSKIKEDLNDNLKKLESVASSERVKNSSLALQAKLKTDIFSLVVVGQFKRGKTTFINALLGKDLLPTAIIPLTSIITIISYGNELKITVFLENGVRKEIALEKLPLYITEKHNPKNEKKVDRVEITYPSPYLKNGVQIIDTPGIASVHEHNTKTTYEYLPRADVAIFLLSVDPPLTQAELLFLRDLKNLVVKTFFIQNKIDTVSSADKEESLSFSKKIIEKEAGFSDVIVYPLSAKEALEGNKKSGLVDFEQALERFLLNEKGEMLLKSATDKINNFINEEMLLAELEEKSLQLPLKELESKIATLKKFIADSEQEKVDSGRLLTEEIKELQSKVLIEDLENLKEEKTKWLITQVDKFALEHKNDGNIKFTELINEFIDSQIRNIFNTWRIEEEIILKKHLEKVFKRFGVRMDKVLEQIIDFSAELFGITNKQFNIQRTLPPEFEFRFETTEQFDILGITIDLVRKALPKVLAHKLILKEAQEKAEMMVDRHCGKSRYDFSERMEQLVRNYRKDVNETISLTQNDILKALEISVKSKQNISTKTKYLETHLHNRVFVLTEIKKSLLKLTTQL